MAFDRSQFGVAVDTIAGGLLRIHSYETTDDFPVVSGANYFTRTSEWGVRPGDLICVTKTDSLETQMGTVQAVNAAGHATVKITAFTDELVKIGVVTMSLGAWLQSKLDASTRGAVNGVAPLGSDGKINPSYIPIIPTTETIFASGDLTTLTAPQQASIDAGDRVITSAGNEYAYSGTGSKTNPASYVLLANVSAATLGLGSFVGFTTATLPLSTAATAALAGKEPTIASGSTAQYIRGDKALATLNAAAVGLGSVPNVDMRNLANATSGFSTLKTAMTFVAGDVGLGNVANKSEAMMVASGAIATAFGNVSTALGAKPDTVTVPGNPIRYGADPTGVADSTTAIQNCINNNMITELSTPGTYLVTGALSLGSGKMLTSSNAGFVALTTGTSTGGIIMSGSGAIMVDVRWNCRHAGAAIVNQSYNSGMFRNFFQDQYVGGSPSPMIVSTASGFWFKDNQISTTRQNTSLQIGRTYAMGLNIENHIYGNTWTGAGYGMSVESLDGSDRPEGIKVINNTFACNRRQLWVRCCLDLDIIGNTFDQGGDFAVHFNPDPQGIKSVKFIGNWAAGNGPNPGSAVVFTTGGGSTTNVKMTGNDIGFATFGVYGDDQLARVQISLNSFLNCSTPLHFNQSLYISIKDNHDEGTYGGQSVTLIDGASGGPFIIGDNFWGQPRAFGITNAGKFHDHGDY